MASVERSASVRWAGALRTGSGLLGLDTSGACGELPIDLATRAGEAGGNTSPEELLAAAHAGCFAMSLAAVLSAEGNPPESLAITAVCKQGRVGERYAISDVELTVRGTVPGIDADGFRDAVRRADEGCPLANAIRGSVEITIDAGLAG